jgi:hypothetical protein
MEKKERITSYERAVTEMCRCMKKGSLFVDFDRSRLPKDMLYAALRQLPKGAKFLGHLKDSQLYKDHLQAKGLTSNDLPAHVWFHSERLKPLVEQLTAARGPAQTPPRQKDAFVRFSGAGVEQITSLFQLSDSELAVKLRDLDVMPLCEWSSQNQARKDTTLNMKAKCSLVLATSDLDYGRMTVQLPNVMEIAKTLVPHAADNGDNPPPRKKQRTDDIHLVQMAAKPSEEGRNNRKLILSALDSVIEIAKSQAVKDAQDSQEIRALKGDVRAIHLAVQGGTLDHLRAAEALQDAYEELPRASQTGKPGLLVLWWTFEIMVRYAYKYPQALSLYEDKIAPLFNRDSILGETPPQQLLLLYYSASLFCGKDMHLPGTPNLLLWKQASLKEEFDLLAHALFHAHEDDIANELLDGRAGWLQDDTMLRLPRWFASPVLKFSCKGGTA